MVMQTFHTLVQASKMHYTDSTVEWKTTVETDEKRQFEETVDGKTSRMVTFCRLPDLEKQLTKLDQHAFFVAYHSNQNDDHTTEVEVGIERNGTTILLSFAQENLFKESYIRLTVYRMVGNAYHRLGEERKNRDFPSFEDYKQTIFSYMQNMNQYRLHAIMGTMELRE